MTAHALIHVGLKQLALDDGDRRDLYERVTGKRSLKQMSAAEHQLIVGELRRLGFAPKKKGGGRKYSQKKYVRLIHALWKSLGDLGALSDPTPTGLRSFVRNRAGVSDPEWLTYAQANPVIEALKAMERRAKAGRESAA